MGNVITVSNIDNISIEKSILELKEQGIFLLNLDYEEILLNEGQIIFEYDQKGLYYKLHVGKKSFYAEFEISWEKFVSEGYMVAEVYNSLLKVNDILGKFDYAIFMNSEGTHTVYDTVCDGLSLDDLLKLDLIQERVEPVGNLGLLINKINLFNMNKPESIIK